MTATRYLGATLVAAVLLSACSDKRATKPVEPQAAVVAGTATFAIATAPEFLGAIRLRVVGRGVWNPMVRGSATVMGQRNSGDTTTMLISVTSDGGAFLQVSLADRTRLPSTAVLEATAGKFDGYRVLPTSAVIVATTVR